MAHLIDKDALVAEIKRRMDENSRWQGLPQYFGMMEEDSYLLSFIDTLEVKEVDLEKESASEDLEEKLPTSNSLTEEGLFTFKDGSQAIITEIG